MRVGRIEHGPSVSDGLVELAKTARVTPQALLFGGGVYGGQYAEKFPADFVWGAASLCLGAQFIGAMLLVIVAIAATVAMLQGRA